MQLGRKSKHVQLKTHYFIIECESCYEKYNVFLSRTHGQPGDPGAIAYIGDSITDLLAICSADIGLLIGDNQLTHQAMDHFQIPSIEIQLGDRYYPELHQGQVICVQSWKEIELFLLA